MPKFEKSKGFEMKGSPMQRNFGIGGPIRNEKEKKRDEEAKKRKSVEEYNKNLETKASELYAYDRAFRTGGTWDTADEKTKMSYRAKAQKS